MGQTWVHTIRIQADQSPSQIADDICRYVLPELNALVVRIENK